jgi:hypothetical protein
MNTLLKTTAVAIALMLAGGAQAGVVTNSTDLISEAGHAQINDWLGKNVDLTRIFTKQAGDDSYDWHAAVDNKGSTITIMEIINGNDTRLIGGFNIYDWNATSAWLRSASTDNFLFNLTSGDIYRKNTSTNFQTYNLGQYGAAFGAGVDLIINNDLSSGYANIGNSYGDSSLTGTSTYQEKFTGTFNSWVVGKYETFTLSDAAGFGDKDLAAEDVSTPLAFASLGLIGLMGFRRKA